MSPGSHQVARISVAAKEGLLLSSWNVPPAPKLWLMLTQGTNDKARQCLYCCHQQSLHIVLSCTYIFPDFQFTPCWKYWFSFHLYTWRNLPALPFLLEWRESCYWATEVSQVFTNQLKHENCVCIYKYMCIKVCFLSNVLVVINKIYSFKLLWSQTHMVAYSLSFFHICSGWSTGTH